VRPSYPGFVARTGGSSARGASRAFLVYNVLRLGLLVACVGLGWLATLRGPLLIVVALAVSGALSWFLLRPQRVAMGMAVEQTVERSRARMSRTEAEDAYVDSLERRAATEPDHTVSAAGDPPPS
jgi:hypothetical protein